MGENAQKAVNNLPNNFIKLFRHKNYNFNDEKL